MTIRTRRLCAPALTLLMPIALPGASFANDDTLGEITVTGTREPEARAETSMATSMAAREVVEETRPAHPAELMNRMPGVYVNETTGEGHMTAIRQPITTSPVYLFLEDGIPTRSTGFFNHNALYEVNVPQAEAVEVIRGPGTALYGSDAIGGVINVMTRPAPFHRELELGVEAGEHGWRRLLLDGGDGFGESALRAQLNLTHDDGWRDDTEYDRRSGTLRWDRLVGQGVVTTLLTGSTIDQAQTGSISRDDYANAPQTNYTPIGYREVDAVRLSTTYERETADTLTSITGYLRHNTLDLMPTWQLTYDPQVWKTEHDSIGLLLKRRKDYAGNRTRVILGADIDYSPGSHQEWGITPTVVDGIYVDYTIDALDYDYDVTYSAVSPYAHVETSASARLRLNAGLRLDAMRYAYDNNLSVVDTGTHRRPADTTVSYTHLSPKLGATYALAPNHSIFASYRHGFRAPSESQLFRQGSAENTVDLDPVKADNLDLGLRGRVGQPIGYEVVAYYLVKTDDIVTYQDTTTGTRETQNAGETLHRGIEAELSATPAPAWELGVSGTYAIHTYEQWSPRTGIDYSGLEMARAPRLISNARVAYRPAALGGGRVEFEWLHLGKYWEDDANTQQYEGHELLNLRANHFPSPNVELFGRISNLLDTRYATYANYTAFRGEELTPGAPRSLYVGLTMRSF